MHEQDRAEGHANCDAFRQIAEDRQQEGCGKDCCLAPVVAQDCRDLVLLHHVPGDGGKNRGESCQRDIGCQRSGHEHEEQQEERMQHPGDGTMRVGANIGGRTGNRAGGADAAEQGARDVCIALRDKFAVRAVPSAGHAIGNDSRQ